METIFWTPKVIQEYGIAIILFALFLFLFVRYIKASEKRFSKIEKDLDSANLFIRIEMAEMIKDQQKVIVQNNDALLQHSKDYSRLCKIIGSLGSKQKQDYGNDTEEINYNED